MVCHEHIQKLPRERSRNSIVLGASARHPYDVSCPLHFFQAQSNRSTIQAGGKGSAVRVKIPEVHVSHCAAANQLRNLGQVTMRPSRIRIDSGLGAPIPIMAMLAVRARSNTEAICGSL